MSSKSLKVAPEQLERVKAKLRYSSFPSQSIFATEVGISLSTVNKFFRGVAIASLNFIECCEKLGLDWQSVAEIPNNDEAHLYIKRPPVEVKCVENLNQVGSLIRIKAPKRMGKTTLINWLLKQAQQQGYQIAYWNLLQPQEAVVKDLDRLLQSLCFAVSEQMQLPDQIESSWKGPMGSNTKCTYYFQKHLLPHAETALVLGLDNIDRIFYYPEVAQDFLGLLRSWRDSASVSSAETWKKFRLILTNSTEDYPKLKYNTSPFNVGLAIDLPEFTSEQVEEFAQQYELDLSQEQLQQLLEMFGGSPYLLQEAFIALRTQPNLTLEELLNNAPTSAGLYYNYLEKLYETLQGTPQLAQTFKDVISATESIPVNRHIAFKLDSMGLVKKKGDQVEPRCQLYRLYFKNYLKESDES